MAVSVPRHIESDVTELLGWKPSSWKPVVGGYTPAARYVVRDKDQSAFVKFATTEVTAAHMRREIAAYRAIPETLRPKLYGAKDGGDQPFLVIEDLSNADWPPPWSNAKVRAVLHQATALHFSTANLRPYSEVHASRGLAWRNVADDPSPFLSLGLVEEDWLLGALPTLIDAEAACITEGDSITHWDLRSDNICFVEGQAVFIDWGEACLSSPDLDLGFWAPSLAYEGGPLPEDIVPDAPEVAAYVSGFFAERAGLPPVPDAPRVRKVQREQLSTALPWVIRELGLLEPIATIPPSPSR